MTCPRLTGSLSLPVCVSLSFSVFLCVSLCLFPSLSLFLCPHAYSFSLPLPSLPLALCFSKDRSLSFVNSRPSWTASCLNKPRLLLHFLSCFLSTNDWKISFSFPVRGTSGPCHSPVIPKIDSIGITWEQGNADSEPTTDLLNPNSPFHKIPRDSFPH